MRRSDRKMSRPPGHRGKAPRPFPAAVPANTPPTRDARGRWLRGGPSPNASGRLHVENEVRDLARQHGPYAVWRLAQLARSDDERVAIAACTVLLDRGYGRPAQALTGPAGAPLSLVNVGVITDAAEAARVYAEIIGRPDADLSGLKFAAAPQLEHEHEAPSDPALPPSQGGES